MNRPKRIIVGIAGASGAAYAVRMLELLRSIEGVESHLVLSSAGKRTITLETERTPHQVEALAHRVHKLNDVAAPIASGSYPIDAMIIAPCSVKTLSGVANAYADNLLLRAADVTLKERRRLVLLVRETPLHAGHIRLMQQATEMGAIVMPPVPAFYAGLESIDDMVDQTVCHALALAGVDPPESLYRRWGAEQSDDALLPDESN